VFAPFEALAQDMAWIDAAVEAILIAFQDNQLPVRIGACWSLANFSQILVSSSLSEQIKFSQDRRKLVHRAVETMLAASRDHHKMRAHAARALGHLHPMVEFPRLVSALTMCLDSTLPKARWNACYAAASVFVSSHVCSVDFSVILAPLWERLAHLLLDDMHFKVRIAACAVLCSPTFRGAYGDCYSTLCGTLIQAILAFDEMSGDSKVDFRYRSTLQSRLVSTLTHMLLLHETSDMVMVQPSLHRHIEALIDFAARVNAESLNAFKSAAANLTG